MLAFTRVVMNPGDSRTSTVSFPIRRATSSIASSVAGALSRACTISISFILCTGLKKCMPATRPGFVSEPANSVMLRADVLDAITADAGARRIGGDPCRCRSEPLDLCEKRELDVDALGRCFDNEVRFFQRRGKSA